MKRPKLHNNPLSWVETKQVEIKGIKLSDIQFIAPDKLVENPLNSMFFKEESSDYFQKLRADIEKRGIIVPLIAKRNDMLVAGHNRLRIAKELHLENVPVQYILDELPDDSEKEFIIKDNLYRRHFSSAEWIELYRKLYPDFDNQIIQERRGGGKKWSKTEYSVLLQQEMDNRLTAEKIANDTGQKLSAVQKQLAKYKKNLLNSKPDALQKESNAEKALTEKQSMSAISQSLECLEKELPNISSQAAKKILKKLKFLVHKLEGVAGQ
jgi:ParB-like chromosome segregation protein Spo0J